MGNLYCIGDYVVLNFRESFKICMVTEETSTIYRLKEVGNTNQRKSISIVKKTNKLKNNSLYEGYTITDFVKFFSDNPDKITEDIQFILDELEHKHSNSKRNLKFKISIALEDYFDTLSENDFKEIYEDIQSKIAFYDYS